MKESLSPLLFIAVQKNRYFRLINLTDIRHMAMKYFGLAMGFLIAAFPHSNCDICFDMLEYPDHVYSLEDVSRCHECEWFLMQDDTRSGSSSSYDAANGPEMSRLEHQSSAWCAADKKDYLEITFTYPTKVGGLEVIGFQGDWVKTLKVYYENYVGQDYFAKSLDGSEIFRANNDDTTRVVIKFAMPMVAKLVRIIPVRKRERGCLRVGIYSCEDPSFRILPPTDVASDPVPACLINTRTDCGDETCAQFKTDDVGCQTCECDMTTGGLFEMDIFLDERTINVAQVRLQNYDQPDGTYSAGARYAARFQDHPSNGKYLVYYKISASLSESETENLNAAILHIAEKSCIQLTPYPTGQDIPYYIDFIRDSGCYSPVGKSNGVNKVSIGYGCGQMGIIVHEIMHSLGFWHEQSRPDRDSYVTINWDNIPSNVQFNFQKQGTSTINSFSSPYDYNSLMHYSTYAFTANGQQTITPKQSGVTLGQRTGLSDEDAKQLNAMYECDKLTTTATPTATIQPSTTATPTSISATTTTTVSSTTRPLTTTTTTITTTISTTNNPPTTTTATSTLTTARPTTTTKSGRNCFDENNHCDAWAKSGECSKNPGYMLNKCKKSCRVCTVVEVTTTPTSTTCLDENRSCNAWAQSGECKRNPGYMLRKCRKSCGICKPKGVCTDNNASCKGWMASGECWKNPGYMHRYCKKSCGVCTTKIDCVDQNIYCSRRRWKAHCGNPNSPYVNKFCRKSCGFC